MNHTKRIASSMAMTAVLLASLASTARADAVVDWNIKAGEIVLEARIGTPPAVRFMAITQTAVYEAVNAITRKDPINTYRIDAAPGASIDAAVAAANRVALSKLMPATQGTVETAYQAAIGRIADTPAKAAGIAIGEKAANAVLAVSAGDGAATAETYRPSAIPGVYVPTAIPAVPQFANRKPWLMTSASQFRPAPPPALKSEQWARDLNEVKEFGGRVSTRRTAEQSEIARFWDFSLPSIYHGVVRSVATQPGRDATSNARLFAAVAQAMDDGIIAVFEAKYHYNFWRPVTAIRNADNDGNDATERDASWVSFVDTPMHPEYPSAHSILASAVGTVLKAEVATGKSPMPVLSTSSPTAKGATRRWTTVEDFTQEVAVARIYDGVHFRTATEVGTAMGAKVGELAVKRFIANPM